jgi:uncharacterized protein (DUF1501 family)
MRRPSPPSVDCAEARIISRRSMLGASAASLALWSLLPRSAIAGTRDPRLLTVILRGGLDGLSMIAPIGDPDYVRLRGNLAIPASGDGAGLPLEGLFALNPNMAFLHGLYRKREALMAHAVATPYRGRSHFDGQDVLESGHPAPGSVQSGWLNRAISALPKGDRVTMRGGLAVGPTTALIMRGPVPVLGWAPQIVNPASDDLAGRVLDLYAHRDPILKAALAQGLETDQMALREGMSKEAMAARMRDALVAMRATADGAARLMAAGDGPRVAALAYDGWDTHANEGGATGRLAQLLGGLDGAFEAFEKGLGSSWKDTTVVAITEFGRTARINGTVGTDHGTGTVAFLAGGAIKGGRVLADWPGLKDEQLFDKRDLKPTTDLRAVLKGLLAEQFDLSPAVLGDLVFPQSAGAKPLLGLSA